MSEFDTDEYMNAYGAGSDSGQLGRQRVGPLSLSFVVRGELDFAVATGGASLPLQPAEWDNETIKRWNARYTLAHAEALETAIAKDVHGAKIQVPTDFSMATDTTGPGALPAAIGAIVFRDTTVGHLAELVGVADATFEFIRWIREKDGVVERVDDGVAFLLGWRAIREAMDATDLEAAFVKAIRPKVYDWEGQVEGYLVGLRDESNVYEVPVALDGTVGDIVTVPVALFAQRRTAIDQAQSEFTDKQGGVG